MKRFALFALGAMLLTQTLAAQPTWQYTYTGNKYSTATGVYTTDMRFTLNFSTPAPIPRNLPYSSFFDVKAIATQVSLSDGPGGFSGPAANVFVVFQINATDADGIPLAWDAIIEVFECPFLPVIEGTVTGASEVVGRVSCFTAGSIGRAASQTRGVWTITAPAPATLTAYLLTLVTGMKIGDQGTSLTDQLIHVLTDINNNTLGLACSDLTAFTNHVSAQTGKKITTAQAAQIQTWAGYIGSGIPCR